ncbi:MAG: transporter [Flavobacteriales bacterium]|nr:MAG: transporter [Flavobacteriales bacterium]
MRKIFYVIVLLLGISVRAQDAGLITKSDVLKKVKEQNYNIKIAEQELYSAKGDYRQSNAVFLPNVKLSHTAMATTNPLMAFGFKLNQEIVTQADFNPAALNNPKKIENYATQINIEQPLLNLDAIYQRKAAKTKYKASELQLSRVKDYAILQAEKAYMELQLAYKSVAVLKKALATAKENLRIANSNYKQGYLQKSDVLSVEVRVTELNNQLQFAKSNIINTSNQLQLIMGNLETGVLQPSDSLVLVDTLVNTTDFSIQNRKDVMAYAKAVEARKQLLRSERLRSLPRLNLFGSYELYDDALFAGNANGYLIGAALSWDIFEGGKRLGKMYKNKAELKKSEITLAQYKNESELALSQARRNIMDIKNEVDLAALALQQSDEVLRIRTNRFKQGLEKTTDILQAETQFAQKQLAYYQAVFKYNYAMAYLDFLTKQ